MARLITTDGSERIVTAGKNNKFTLTELQKAIDGCIQTVPGIGRPTVIVDEDAIGKQKPLNRTATRLVHDQIAKHLHCTVDARPGKVGRRLLYLP